MNDIIIKIANFNCEDYQELTLKSEWHEKVLLVWDGEEAPMDIPIIDKPFCDDVIPSMPGLSQTGLTDIILNMLTCACILRPYGSRMMTAFYCVVHNEFSFTPGHFASPCEDDNHILVVIKEYDIEMHEKDVSAFESIDEVITAIKHDLETHEVSRHWHGYAGADILLEDVITHAEECGLQYVGDGKFIAKS